MNCDCYVPVGGCLLFQGVGQLPKFGNPLCPECKKPLSVNGDAYSCQHCQYSTNRRQTDEAIARHKARLG